MDRILASRTMAPRTRRFLYELTGVDPTAAPSSAVRPKPRRAHDPRNVAPRVSAALAAGTMLAIAVVAVSLVY